MHQVIITIGKDGKVRTEVNGVKGAACKNVTAKLRKLGQVERDDNTPEYYEEAEVEQTVGTGW